MFIILKVFVGFIKDEGFLGFFDKLLKEGFKGFVDIFKFKCFVFEFFVCVCMDL